MCFLNLRQRTESVQGSLIVTPAKVSKQMVKWTASIAAESIVLVEGVIEKVQEPIKSASVSDVEVHISKVKLAASSLAWILTRTLSGLSYLWNRRSPSLLSR